jgi:hypothetical protein
MIERLEKIVESCKTLQQLENCRVLVRNAYHLKLNWIDYMNLRFLDRYVERSISHFKNMAKSKQSIIITKW